MTYRTETIGAATGNPYFVTGPALVSFSGGRTSGYMLKHILDAHGGTLPDDVHVTFANTGKEREETLRFVHECGSRWNVPIRWLEQDNRKAKEFSERFLEVGYNSASRDGEPFERLITRKSYLPNSVMRFCTTELKIEPMKFFMKSQGYKKWTNVVGLRADERHRVNRGISANAKGRDPWVSVFPLNDAGVSNRMVRDWWDAQDFDLGLLPFEGNCDGCFLKARPKLIEVERTKPGTLKWWADMETLATTITKKQSGGTFRPEYTFLELIKAARFQGDLFEGAFNNDPDMDAECGLWCGEAP
jgi:3'-phosphoadenosine 5'-phosphosulfate sulfotransferase (PAPS reductase)/FAD synthetase